MESLLSQEYAKANVKEEDALQNAAVPEADYKVLYLLRSATLRLHHTMVHDKTSPQSQ